jgi:ribosomal protein S18 acetylase RimI-like enzyme
MSGKQPEKRYVGEPKARPDLKDISFRHDVRRDDIESVRLIVDATRYFTPQEVLVALELVQDNLVKGAAESGYYFVFSEWKGRTIGYTCYGPIPCTASSFNLYWIAVHPDFQGRGIGQTLLRETEKMMRAAGGTRSYIDTSFKDQYEGTRAFYQMLGYTLAAKLDDYYGPGDAKIIYLKSF